MAQLDNVIVIMTEAELQEQIVQLKNEILMLKAENKRLNEELKNYIIIPPVGQPTPIAPKENNFTMSEDSLLFWKSRWDYYP